MYITKDSIRNICVKNDHGYVPFVVSTSRSIPHSWLITRFVTRLTRQLPLVEQELLTLPEHVSSSPVFSRVCVTLSLVLYVCFVDRYLCFFLFGPSLLSIISRYPSLVHHYWAWFVLYHFPHWFILIIYLERMVFKDGNHTQ
jgi:hypothetical protein